MATNHLGHFLLIHEILPLVSGALVFVAIEGEP